MNEEKVYEILKELDIKYIIYEHPPIYTVEEANKLEIEINGQHCKNLFLKNRKGNKYYLVILDDKKQVNLKNLSKEIEVNGLSFASEEKLEKYLGVKPGAVTPFGLINDEDKEVIVLIDKELKRDELISFHPNINTKTISLNYDDFERFLKEMENEFIYFNLD